MYAFIFFNFIIAFCPGRAVIPGYCPRVLRCQGLYTHSASQHSAAFRSTGLGALHTQTSAECHHVPSTTRHKAPAAPTAPARPLHAQCPAQGSPTHVSSLPELGAGVRLELTGSCPSSGCQTQHTTDGKRRQTEQTAAWNLLFSNQSCCVGSILATGTQVCKNTEFSQ